MEEQNPQCALDFEKDVFLTKSNLKSIYQNKKRLGELFEDSDDDLIDAENIDLDLFGDDLMDESIGATIVTPDKDSSHHALDGSNRSNQSDDLISGRTRSQATKEQGLLQSRSSGWGQAASRAFPVRKTVQKNNSVTEDVDIDLFGNDSTDDSAIPAEPIGTATIVTPDEGSKHLKRKTRSSEQSDDLISGHTRSHARQSETHARQSETHASKSSSGWGEVAPSTRPTRKAAVATQPYFRVPPQKISKYIPSKSMIHCRGFLEVIKKSNDQFLLRYLFKDRLKLHLSKVCEELNETEYFGSDEPWQLIATKHEKPNSHFYDSGAYIKAFYIQGKKSKIQKELEQLADFGSLWYNPGKLAMRIELLVTPASRTPFGDSDSSYMFNRPLEEFEVLDLPENATMGCGFIPLKLLKELLGYGSKGNNAVAVQVRVLSPHLGLFKGMLVAKPDIDQIQLNKSMLKVGPSVSAKTNKNLLNRVLLLFNNVCPSERSENLERDFNPNHKLKPRKRSDEYILQSSFERVLRCSVQSGDEEEFEQVLEDYKAAVASDYKFCQHAPLTGVCDPTNGSIPEGHVFIPSFPFGFNDGKKHLVSLTRVPCTEAADLITVPVVTNKPRGMRENEWDFLTNLSFGAVMFGNPKDALEPSLPEKINDSDLDGDRFCTTWNQSLVNLVSKSKKQTKSHRDQDVFKWNDEVEALFDFKNDRVYGKEYHLGNIWKIPYREEGGEELYDIKYKSGEIRRNVSVDKIRAFTGQSYTVSKFTGNRKRNNKIEVQVEYENGKHEWKDLDVLIDNGFEDELAVYATENNLMEKDGWAFVKSVSLRDTPIIKVNELKLKNNTCQALVLFDGDIQAEWVEAKSVDIDILYEYLLANEKRRNVLQKSKKWSWLDNQIAKKQADWVELLQMELVSPKLHRYDLFIKALHKEYKNLNFHHNQSDAEAFGRAYKAANDVRKHGGRVKLPSHLREWIATGKRQFFHEFIEDI